MAHVHFHTSSHLATFILTVTISQLVTVAQISVVAFPDKFIAADLNTSASQAAWPLAAYAHRSARGYTRSQGPICHGMGMDGYLVSR
ncbi:unnamed protein product [Parajaminaea phylloscopi]